VIVTRGAKGAILFTPENTHSVSPIKIRRLVDTVGAGDGFSAVCLAGLIKDWSYPTTLKRAAEFAAEICQQRGAISQDEEFYNRYQNRWML
jgi:fructokinase